MWFAKSVVGSEILHSANDVDDVANGNDNDSNPTITAAAPTSARGAEENGKDGVKSMKMHFCNGLISKLVVIWLRYSKIDHLQR